MDQLLSSSTLEPPHPSAPIVFISAFFFCPFHHCPSNLVYTSPSPDLPILIVLSFILPDHLPTSIPPSSTTPVVTNNSNELGPEEELALPPNETSVTLSNLKYSTRYKFSLSAKTVRGPGPAISQEAVTIVDEGKSADTDLRLKIDDLCHAHKSK